LTRHARAAFKTARKDPPPRGRRPALDDRRRIKEPRQRAAGVLAPRRIERDQPESARVAASLSPLAAAASARASAELEGILVIWSAWKIALVMSPRRYSPRNRKNSSNGGRTCLVAGLAQRGKPCRYRRLRSGRTRAQQAHVVSVERNRLGAASNAA